jgi:hypothetical protein
MEPYPKSRAKDLHPDEIEVEAETPGKVSFVPFMGISPFRYRDIFQKSRRKRDDGSALDWYDDKHIGDQAFVFSSTKSRWLVNSHFYLSRRSNTP